MPEWIYRPQNPLFVWYSGSCIKTCNVPIVWDSVHKWKQWTIKITCRQILCQICAPSFRRLEPHHYDAAFNYGRQKLVKINEPQWPLTSRRLSVKSDQTTPIQLRLHFHTSTATSHTNMHPNFHVKIKKGDSVHPSVPDSAATVYPPGSLRWREYYMPLFLLVPVNPVGKLPKPGDHHLWQMENLSKGIIMLETLVSHFF